MAKKDTDLMRVFPETKRKIEDLKIDVMGTERKPISNHEIARRVFNIPNIKEILIKDAEEKRRKRDG